ncbi:hypothetical protein [Hyphomicrobium sulfonivorans]|nr:hypothetical protein [Hyphomicrobium sulfonivorans]MBI1650125.1 hypothetical protein [Hyphomicrobium sulfonivorans]
MDGMEDFGERFLKANANVDYMASVLAQMLRNCMRASASQDPAGQTYEAMQNYMTLQKLVGYSEGVKAYELFEKAIAELRIDEQNNRVDAAIVHAAKMGLRVLVEKSCYDGAAGGRASRREDEFLNAIERIEPAREEERKKWEQRHQRSDGA